MGSNKPKHFDDLFEKIFAGPKPAEYYRSSSSPHRRMLAIAEDYFTVVSILSKDERISRSLIHPTLLPKANEIRDALDFKKTYQESHCIEKAFILGICFRLNLMDKEDAEFLWGTYFTHLRCSFHNDPLKEDASKVTFHVKKNKALFSFFNLLGKPFKTLLNELDKQQQAIVESALLPFVKDDENGTRRTLYHFLNPDDVIKEENLSEEERKKIEEALTKKK